MRSTAAIVASTATQRMSSDYCALQSARPESTAFAVAAAMGEGKSIGSPGTAGARLTQVRGWNRTEPTACTVTSSDGDSDCRATAECMPRPAGVAADADAAFVAGGSAGDGGSLAVTELVTESVRDAACVCVCVCASRSNKSPAMRTMLE